MANLETTYMGLSLKNPIIIGSSGLTATAEQVAKAEKMGAGAVVLKSIFEEQVRFETDRELSVAEYGVHTEAQAYLDTMTLNHSIENYLNLISEAKASVSIPVIASVHCFSDGDWTTFAKRIQEKGADALELNLMLTDFSDKSSQDIEAMYLRIVETVLANVTIPVALKIGTLFSNLPAMVRRLDMTKIRGFVMFNRYWNPDIDLNNQRITTGPSLSQPAEITTPLRWIGLLSANLSSDIAGSTGIHDGEGAIKMILAGASAVQICSVLYDKGLESIGTIVQEMSDWMDANNVATLAEIKGKLSAHDDQERTLLFGRTQYMEYHASL